MSSKKIPLAAALAAALVVATAGAIAQTAKPSPYEGVSRPPADDIITTSDEPPAQPPAVAPAPVQTVNPTPAPVAKAAPAAPETLADADDDAELNSHPVKLSRRSTAVIDSRDDGDNGIVTYVPGPANALPEGTVIRATMLQNIVASDAIPGTPFRARLTQDLVHNGQVVVPAGSELRGKIVYATSGRRITGRSSIHLRPDELVLPNGIHYRLNAEVIDTQGSDTKPAGEGNIVATGHTSRTLTELAATSGGGAIIGAVLGGPAGAAIGSAVGAGITGTHYLFGNQSAELPEQSTVIFSLTDPMFLTPAKN